MSDIYIPGLKSRLNTEQIVEDLMKLERIPRDRAEKNIEGLQTQKVYWQDIGRRINSLRENARLMYSFQNPFSERTARSSDESVLSASATRQAVEQERVFTVKQTAGADRFLSNPLDLSYKIDAGVYTFRAGPNTIDLNFQGGSVREFAEALNSRGKDKIKAGVLTVNEGTQSLLIESLLTGEANRLDFSGAAEGLIEKTGMAEKAPNAKQVIQDDPETVGAGKRMSIALNAKASAMSAGEGMILTIETATRIIPPAENPPPPEGPVLPAAGSASYGGITIENDQSSVPVRDWNPPPGEQRVDDAQMLSLQFTDGSAAALPPVKDSQGFSRNEYRLSDIAGGKSIASIEIANNNTHRDISVRGISIYDSGSAENYRPKNAVSTAQDAVMEMEGIEIRRPTNSFNDLIPGVSITVKSPSDQPVHLTIEPDRESVKEAVVTMVGSYNLLMAEINVLTRNDDKVVQELNFLRPDEQSEMRKKLGAFSAESSLGQFRNRIQQTASSPYPTIAGQDISLLAQIGIGTDVRRSGGAGYDASRLRGYLEIDEKTLDAAIASNLPAVQQLFGRDTDGDLIVDSGFAYALDSLTKPYVESGGIISAKTGTIDSKIDQEQRRITTLNRQLEAKEVALKKQYGQMENAYSRMERMSTSLDQFNQRMQSTNNR